MKNIEVINPVGYKLELYPTDEQIKTFNKYFGVARFIYNQGINMYKEERGDSDKYKILTYFDLTNKLTKLKSRPEYEWLNQYDVTTLKYVLRDVNNAYTKYFKGLSNHPTYKSKKIYSNHMQFPVRGDRMSIGKGFVYIPSIGKVLIDKRIPKTLIGKGNKRVESDSRRYIKYLNPRIIYDGCTYYISFNLEEDTQNGICNSSANTHKYNEIWSRRESQDVIGIDFGCKGHNWLVASNGTSLSIPDMSKEEKRKRKLQKKFSRQLNENQKRWEKTNPSEPRRKRTKNELKTLKAWNKVEKRMVNKKKTALYEYISHNILDHKPTAVVIEDIRTSNLLLPDNSGINSFHRKRHNHKVMKSMPYTVRTIITQTVSRNEIPVIIADCGYPSSQLCSCCGHRVDIGKREMFKCPMCGNIMNRDENASLNLKRYGEIVLGEKQKSA